MDFDNLVAKLFETVLRLFRDVSYAGYEFVVNPTSLAQSISSPSGNRPGPLTFFVFPLIVFVVELLIIRGMSRGTKIRVQISPSPEEWSKAVSTFDPKAWLKAAAPFVLIVAVHAAFVNVAFNVFKSNVSYESVFAAGCYAGGTVFLVFAVVGAGYVLVLPRLLPRLRREADSPPQEPQKPKLWMWLLAAPPWLIFLKAVHSYFELLSVLTGASIWTAIGSWFGGTAGFGLVVLALFAWFSPAIFPDPSAETGGTEPDAPRE